MNNDKIPKKSCNFLLLNTCYGIMSINRYRRVKIILDKFLEMIGEKIGDFVLSLVPIQAIIFVVCIFVPIGATFFWFFKERNFKKKGKNPCMHFRGENGKSFCEMNLLKYRHKRCPKRRCRAYSLAINIKEKQLGISLCHIAIIWIICIALIVLVISYSNNKAKENSVENVDTVQSWNDDNL